MSTNRSLLRVNDLEPLGGVAENDGLVLVLLRLSELLVYLHHGLEPHADVLVDEPLLPQHDDCPTRMLHTCM